MEALNFSPTTWALLAALIIAILALIIYSPNKSLNKIKTKKVGDGQHGNARFATNREIYKTYVPILFEPNKWRWGVSVPLYPQKTKPDKNSNNNRHWKHTGSKECTTLTLSTSTKTDPFADSQALVEGLQRIKAETEPKTVHVELGSTSTAPTTSGEPLYGTILGTKMIRGKLQALVAPDDTHTIMIAAAGAGKTACFLYPNIELCMAGRVSFVTTDTKGDLLRDVGTIAQKYYGYDVKTIDLRNPAHSDGFNMLAMTSKYMDLAANEKAKGNPYKAFRSKAENYAKIIAKTIIGGEDSDRGANAFFYESAEGILTAAIMLVCEFGGEGERHIVSVAKLIQETLGKSDNPNFKGKIEFQLLLDQLPSDHKARFFAGAALNTSEEGMRSVMSTALSRLNAFIDTELEQILCFDSCIDAEEFCQKPTALFIIMPEEDSTKYFLVSLAVQQLYRELMTYADICGGKLPKRVMFYLDEIGTIPRISSLEMLLSAGRSRQLYAVLIIQSLAQLKKNYGDLGAEIIIDNTQNAIFSGFAPNSETAKVLSDNLGQYTVQSGSVSKGKEGSSESLQMIGKHLLDIFELKTLPKFTFVTMKTGALPIKTMFPLFFKWGINFEEPFKVPYKGDREVRYVNKAALARCIYRKYSKNRF